ncbi:MAG: outer membrane protein [Alphaproteobacteria bacterium]
MKKSIVYSAFLSSALVASGAFANDGAVQPAPAKNPCHMGGFYIGAAVGYGSHKARTDQKLTSALVATDPLRKNDLSLDGANGGLFLGYGKEFGGSRVYLGLEFGYFMDGSKGKSEYTPVAVLPGDLLKTEAKRKDGLELAARMGLIFNQTMPYLKLGWANTKVEATQVVAADTALVGPAVPVQLTQKFLNKRLNGFLVGAGIDMKLNRNLIAGLEYTYATYQKKGTRQAVATGTDITDANNWDSKLKLSDNKFRLRLAYQF